MAKQPSSKNQTASKDKGSTRPASATASRRNNPSSSSHSSSTQRVDLVPQRSLYAMTSLFKTESAFGNTCMLLFSWRSHFESLFLANLRKIYVILV